MKKAIYDGKGKLCNTCKEIKQLDAFNVESDGKYGVRAYCKECQHKKSRDYYTSKTGSVVVLNQRIKTRYGITLSDYRAMVEKQGSACAICKSIPNKLFIDHNHSTNENRGLLCSQCNTLLGMSKDSISILESAIEYLKLTESQLPQPSRPVE